VRVAKNGLVVWRWTRTTKEHNVTFSRLGENSEDQEAGRYRLGFKNAGTFRYVCTIHGFRGSVVVS